MPKEKKTEYTVKELSESKKFPYRERMIRQLIKDGRLKGKFYGPGKLRVTVESVQEFLKANLKRVNKKK